MELKFSLLLFVIAALITFGCDSSGPSSGSSKSYRIVAYPVSTQDASGADEYGLYIYKTSTKKLERKVEQPVVYCSNIALNKTMVFEYENEAKKIWGLCEGQMLMQVPEPVFTDSAFTYFMPPRIALSADGHNAAYFVYCTGNSSSPDSGICKLILQSCTSDSGTTIVDFDSFVKAKMSSLEVNKVEPEGDIIISFDGSNVWFEVKGMKDGDVMGRMILHYKDSTIEQVSDQILNNDVELLCTNENVDYFCLRNGDKIALMDSYDGSITNSSFLKSSDIATRNQISLKETKLIMWTGDTDSTKRIIMYANFNESLEYDVIYLSAVEEKYGSGLYEPTDKLAISPEGGYVTFVLKRKDNGLNDLFICSQYGEGLEKIAENINPGYPVISDLVKD